MKKNKERKDDFYSFYQTESKGGAQQEPFKRAQRRSPWIRALVAVFVGLLAASAWFGYLFFSDKIGGSQDPLSATGTGPETAENGTIIEYTFEYQNRGTTAVSDVALFAEYPIGFTLIESEPASQNSMRNYWNIGTLEKGAKGRIVVRGTLTGFERDERKAVFSLQYQHPLYRSSFSIKKEVLTVMSAATAERLYVAVPPTINAGAGAQITIRYQDVSRFGNPENVFLKLLLPDGLSIESSEPEVSRKDTNEWNGYALSKTTQPDSDGGVLRVTLKTSDTLQGAVPIAVQLILREADRTDSILRESKSEVTVLRNDLSLALVSAGSDVLRALRQDFSQNLAVTLANKGNVTLRDLEVRLTLPPEGVNYKKSVFEGGERKEDGVIWNFEKVASLKEIKNGDAVVLPFTLTLDAFMRDTPLAIQLDARVASRVEKDGNINSEPLEIQGPRMSAQILSDARVRAFLRDVSDAQNSQEKTFRVYIAVTNSLHDLDDIVVTVPLSKSTAWVGVNSRTAGDIGYDEKERAVTWRLNALPASVKRIDGSFDIALPSSLFNQDVRLVEKIVLRTRDRTVGENIEQTIEGLTPLQTDESL